MTKIFMKSVANCCKEALFYFLFLGLMCIVSVIYTVLTVTTFGCFFLPKSLQGKIIRFIFVSRSGLTRSHDISNSKPNKNKR